MRMRVVLIPILALLLLGVTTLSAQEEVPDGSGSEGSGPGTAPSPDDLLAIDDIIDTEEEMLAGDGYTYEPGNRRDPFKSLLAARNQPRIRGPRPEGIPGLLIEETDLTGIFLTPAGPVAQIQSADSDKSYLLRVGDQLYDGDVLEITVREVVFKQIVDDPTALKPFREVVKRLNH
jgi:hypothetical protein